MSRFAGQLATGILSVALMLAGAVSANAQSVFINEFHYDNTGTDAGEFVEVAGPAGTNLSGWSVVLYNGANGAVYDTIPLSGTIDNEGASGFGALSFLRAGIQNGAPDGLALVNASAVVQQFLCYEGTFAAVGGVANSSTCTDVGVSQNGTEALGSSLKLQGTGSVYSDFVWAVSLGANTAGSINALQTFNGTPAPLITINPTGGNTGTAVPVAITGTNTNFVQGTTAVGVSGAGITVGAITVTDGTHLSTTFTISGGAALGPRTVTATTNTEAPSTAFSVTNPSPITRIHDVQGNGASSPLAGTTVTIEGIVVGDFETTAKLNGFFVQEENSDVDADPLTSEGIFVYNPGNNSVSVGQKVQVSGLVSEFHGLTEITASSIAASAGEAVSPAVISFPLASLTQLEQYEGMAIRIDQPMTVSETFLHGRYNQLLLAQGGRLFTPTNVALPGIAAANVLAANALRSIILDDDRTTQNPDPVVYPENGGLSANNTARVGEIVDGAILGILDCFDAYLIRPTGNLTFLSPIGNPRPTSPSAAGGTLRVASMNVLNYFTTFIGGRGAENQVEFDRQAPKIVDAILAMNPHVLGIMEVENNGNTAIADLVTKLNVPVPGKFQYINTGTVGTDQIKVGLIYQPSVVSPVGLPLILNNTVDPRAVDTLNRPVVAQTFERIGTRQDLQRFTVIVNHFKSKGSGCETQSYPVGVGGTFDTDQNDGQGNCNLTRLNIAAALNDWMASSAFAPTPVAERRFLVIGDLNAYAFEDPMSALTSTSFTKAPVIPAGNPNATSIDLTNLYIPAGSYSYVFDGQSGNLDHALASPAMEKLVTGFSEFHINADEPVAIDYNLNFKSAGQQISFFAPNMYRSSDHDPVVVNFNPLCGDLNDDGSVSVADQNLLRARYGQSAAGANRRYDYDRNGTINSNDYRLWLTCQRQFVN